MRVTTHAMRCVEKAGGLDRYLLDTPVKKLQSELAVELRAKIAEALKVAA